MQWREVIGMAAIRDFEEDEQIEIPDIGLHRGIEG